MKRSMIKLFAVILGLFVGLIDVNAQELSSTLFPAVSKANRTAEAQRPVESPTDLDRLIRIANEDGSVKVIVGFRIDNYEPDSSLAGPAQKKQRDDIERMQISLLDRLRNFSFTNAKRFEYIPFIALETSADALRYLIRSSDVTFIQEDEVNYPMLPQSIPILGGSPFGGATGGTFGGFSGAGRTVAILDTGIDKAHPFFNNRVVSEACYSTTSGSTTSFCPGGAGSSTASGSGVQCPANVDGCAHGTHVAGIAAGGNPLISGNGVARNANIIAMQVFSRTTDCGGNPSPCTTAFTSDVILGLERVYALRTVYSIDSVNMSLGSGRYFNYCDTEQAAYKSAIDALRSAGIVSIIASGNDGYADSISAPACVSTGISVGSTNDGDSFPVDFVSSFSNAALMLNLLAPGELILSAVPGGSYDNKQGTSMAAPMVAGAWAVMKEKFPGDTIPQTLTRLRYSGVQVLDSRQGLVKPRIKLDAALNASNADPCSSTTAISFGQTVNGSFTNTDCLMLGGSRTDIYTFNGTQGQGIAITESAAFFTYLFLVDANGNVIGQNGGGLTSRIPAGTGFLSLPATGTYRIYATTVEGNRLGNYTLNLATNGCTFGVSSSSANVAASAGSGNFNVTTTAGCAWAAQSNAAWLTTSSAGSGNGAVNYNFVANTGAQRTGTITVGGQTHTVTQASVAVTIRSPFDFDGDQKTDLSIFRPGPGEWWWLKSSTGGNAALQFGASTDRLVPVDFTGDGKTDVAFWRPSTGQWFVLRSEDFSFYAFPFGANGDVPVPADFDGDGKADPAVFRESSSTWFINKSSGGTDIFGFGSAGDKTAVADYDGDGKADVAIFRPVGVNGAEWWVRRSSNAAVVALQFGSSTDKAVPGDFTGDGKADIAFWRPSTGFWNVLRSEDLSYFAFPFGTTGDVPVAGDYDGDGKTDAGVFRPSNSTWFIQRSSAGTLIQQFGAAGDVPLPSAFLR
ncbi:MAG: S8 family serine peptidase [Acidobacteria bacterium]|nr:S8 family serine peptidase [Acidobacteriota bacterium]